MRSIRYRKLMQAAKRLSEGQSLRFEMKTNENTICECQLQIWKEELLQQLEKGPSVKELLLEFKDWLEIPAEMMGKKSNEIALSKSRVYCLKNISSEDVEEFQKIFKEYIEFKTNKESLLVPIYALVSLHSAVLPKNKWSESFIFMPNLGTGDAIIFDIKGYCDSRLVEERDFRDFKFGKDQNFIKSQFLQMVEQLPQSTRQQLFSRIQTNLAFLKSICVIDYSLLLIFKAKPSNEEASPNLIQLNEKYEMGINIIDFFQVFNQRKKLQNKFKSFFFKEISSVDPLSYANRMLEFMKKVLLVKI